MIDTAIQNIEGKITMKEAQRALSTAIMKKDQCICPMMSVPKKQIRFRPGIAEILSETAFSFSPNEYISIHRKLFQVFINMPERFEITTLQRKNGCLMEQPLCTVVRPN